MFAQDKYRITACYVALRWGSIEVIDKLLEWVKEVLNRDELNNKFLFSQIMKKTLSCIMQHFVTMYINCRGYGTGVMSNCQKRS